MKYLNKIFIRKREKKVNVLFLITLGLILNFSAFSQYELLIGVGNNNPLTVINGGTKNVPITIAGNPLVTPLIDVSVYLHCVTTITNTNTGASYMVNDFIWDFHGGAKGIWNTYDNFTIDIPRSIPTGEYEIFTEVQSKLYPHCPENFIWYGSGDLACSLINSDIGPDPYSVHIGTVEDLNNGNLTEILSEGGSWNLPFTLRIGIINVNNFVFDNDDVFPHEPFDYEDKFGTLGKLGSENLNENIVEVWPNPANTMVNTSINLEEFRDGVLKLFSPDGREVMSKNIDPNTEKASIDVSNIENGIYILKIIADGKEIHTQKLTIAD